MEINEVITDRKGSFYTRTYRISKSIYVTKLRIVTINKTQCDSKLLSVFSVAYNFQTGKKR
jgi:hypothetical protein